MKFFDLEMDEFLSGGGRSIQYIKMVNHVCVQELHVHSPIPGSLCSSNGVYNYAVNRQCNAVLNDEVLNHGAKSTYL